MKNPFWFIPTLHKFSQMQDRIEELEERINHLEGQIECAFKDLVWWKHKALTFMDLHKGKNNVVF